MEMKLSYERSIPVDLGVVSGHCFGGRFRDFDPTTRRLIGVKMAAEIDHPCHIDIPTQDFSIPDSNDMQEGMYMALLKMSKGNDIYVGCMGGIGRTGLFMGCLAKILIDYHEGSYLGFTDPVNMVRSLYKGHAIETDEQQAFVRGFDSERLVSWLWAIQPEDQPEFQSVVTEDEDHFGLVQGWWNGLAKLMTSWMLPRN